MISALRPDRQEFYGLIELDSGGTVLYSRLEKNGLSDDVPADMTGQNFYTEVAPFENVEKLRKHLDDFRNGSRQSDTINFNCQYEDGIVPVRVVMTRISKQPGYNGVTKSILVRIRKAK